MKFFVGVTDNQWFDFLRQLASGLPEPLDEVNFWQPGGGCAFKSFNFKLSRLKKSSFPEEVQK
ncbi:MAG: hypothetical protein AB1715_11475 [Acidobacteriota bacterium]